MKRTAEVSHKRFAWTLWWRMSRSCHARSAKPSKIKSVTDNVSGANTNTQSLYQFFLAALATGWLALSSGFEFNYRRFWKLIFKICKCILQINLEYLNFWLHHLIEQWPLYTTKKCLDSMHPSLPMKSIECIKRHKHILKNRYDTIYNK